MSLKLEKARKWLENKKEMQKTSEHFFGKADKNGDGLINLKEAKKFIKQLFNKTGLNPPSKVIERCFKAHAGSDDDDKTLSKTEWTEFLYATTRELLMPHLDIEDKIRYVFDKLDKDKSGSVSKSETKELLKDDKELNALLDCVGGTAHNVLKELNNSADDDITYEGLRALLVTPAERLSRSFEQEDKPQKISDEAINKAAKDWGLTSDETENLKSLIKKLDSDGSGTISVIELGKETNSLMSFEAVNNASEDDRITLEEFMQLKYGDRPS